MEALVGKRRDLPASHPGGHHGNPVDTTSRIGNVATDLAEAVVAEQLTRAGHVVLAFKAVSRRIVAALLREGRARDAESRIALEFLEEKLHVARVEGYVGIQIAEDLERDVLHHVEPSVDRVHFACEIP